MTENEKIEAYIAYRSKKIDKVRKRLGRKIWSRILFPWRNRHGSITPSSQVEMRKIDNDCKKFWEKLDS